MKCKHCQAELEEGVLLCPECGTDNAEPQAEETEQKAAEAAEAVQTEENKDSEIKEGIKATPGKIVLAFAAVLVLIAVFLVLIVGGLSDMGAANPTDSTESSVTTEQTVPATAPVGTGLNDVSCKGSYTVSDEDAAAAKDVVIATVGDQQLTNSQLQAYYWLQVRTFLYSNSYYLSMLGLDYTQGLDTQLISEDIAAYLGMEAQNITWQQFFLEQAVNAWHTYAALLCAADAEGYEFSEEAKEYLDGLDALLASDAETNGFETVDEMTAYLMGAGASGADYKAYESTYYSAYAYYQNHVEAVTYTHEELEAFFDAHAAEYEANGLTKDMCTVDVRHILIMPQGATSETIRTETFPQEAWDASKAEAEALLQQWLEGEATEESFGLLANEHSDDANGQVTNGGLYEDVTTGQMVESFDAWCFDTSREPGHYGIVETEFGYHIMYFVGSELLWPVYAENDIRTEAANTLLNDAIGNYPLEVDYKSVVLGFVDLSK